MKNISTHLLLVALLTTLIYGEEKPKIVLHAVKIVKIDAYRAIILEDDYGYIVINDGDEATPRPRYILGSQRDGTVIHYKDKKAFLEAIGKIPAGASLREYAKCLAPLSLGLTEEQMVYLDILRIAKEKAIKFAEDPKLHCNCESSLIEKR